MLKNKLIGILVPVVLFLFLISEVHAANLTQSGSVGFFSEGFEVQNYQTLDKWRNTTSGTRPWKSQTATVLTGSRSAGSIADEISNASMILNMSTQGWKNITVSWKWLTSGTLTRINVSYWNGTSWTFMKALPPSTTETFFKYNLSGITVVENQTNRKFQVKFSCVVTTVIGAGRTCAVDDVNVTGLVPIYPLMKASTNRTTPITAVINWTTDRPANTTVNYGTTKSLGTIRNIQNSVTAHNVTLTGLSINTKYYYNITSAYYSNRKINGSYVFNTKAGASCTYSGSGNWVINFSENCIITTNIALQTGRNVTVVGFGNLTLNRGNITNYKQTFFIGLAGKMSTILCQNLGCFKL